MAITDIEISEELETSAPSIKYSGDEGPKSPQEIEMMMADAMLKEEYNKYVFDLLEIRPEATPMTLEEFRQMVIAEGQMSGGQPLPQDPTKPVNPFAPKPTGPVLPDRQMAAYGGIMGLDGRRQYGIGSSLKKFVRKVIPNEVAKVAEVAAPFVAPFNPLAAGLMKGIGGFDRTGSIGDSLKSGLLTYGGGQLARGIGGGMGNLQTGFNPMGGFGDATTFGKGLLSNPMQGEGGLSKFLADRRTASTPALKESTYNALLDDEIGADNFIESMVPKAKDIVPKTNTGKILKTIKDFALDNKLLIGLAAGTLGGTALMGNMEPEEIQDLQRGEGLDVEAIRAEVIEAYKDPSGEKLKALSSKYPFLSKRRNIDVDRLAMGGRISKAEGGIMDLGGMEKDYRNTGGFVDIGEYEKKDDVPARLSVNEFVMTADAVRGMGDGDIDLGAKRMENLMGAMENKKGAQQMFDVSERLSEVV
jgi:uncharacterized short protein YbdD (DUF466 family)